MMRVIYLESYQLSMELEIEHNASRHPENLPGHTDKLAEIQAAFETQVTEQENRTPIFLVDVLFESWSVAGWWIRRSLIGVGTTALNGSCPWWNWCWTTRLLFTSDTPGLCVRALSGGDCQLTGTMSRY